MKIPIPVIRSLPTKGGFQCYLHKSAQQFRYILALKPQDDAFLRYFKSITHSPTETVSPCLTTVSKEGTETFYEILFNNELLVQIPHYSYNSNIYTKASSEIFLPFCIVKEDAKVL